MALPVLNVNVGVLGHVDSGKTSLVRALSTSLSTAALDKHPQSVERGITLDLGFSAFTIDLPAHLASLADRRSALQFTLVDCPGHASLIRTVVGGAQIIDMVLLVIDVTKGIQTQTAECLVIAEVYTDRLIVVLNKTDMLPEEGREKKVEAAAQRVRKALASTRFAAAPFVALAAAPGGGGKLGAAAPLPSSAAAEGGGVAERGAAKAQAGSVADLVALMGSTAEAPVRRSDGPFLFSVDHCFPIKGQGTVLTGTVLAGRCRVGDVIELAALRQERKIKSMQMFRRPVDALHEGDRAGICVTNLDAALVERGLLCAPGSVPLLHGAIALVRKIRYFKGRCASESKFHVTVGHSTVLATAVFFGARELASRPSSVVPHTSASAASLAAAAGDGSPLPLVPRDATAASAAGTANPNAPPPFAFDWTEQHEWQDELLGPAKRVPAGVAGAAPSTAEAAAGGRSDVHAATCRLAFEGRLVEPLASADIHELSRVNLIKVKTKQGVCDRIDDAESSSGAGVTIIGRSLFKKETDMSQFLGLRVHTRSGQVGTIIASFGKGGKFKAHFPTPGNVDYRFVEGSSGGVAAPAAAGAGAPAAIRPGDSIFLRYRKRQYDAHKDKRRMTQ